VTSLPMVSRVFLVAGLLGLAACAQANLNPATRGGPEKVVLSERPFPDFTYQEEQGGLWLAGDMFINPDKTLADPVKTLQTFAQMEYTANQMKGVYNLMSPADLNDLLRARQVIRTTMNLPADVPVDQAVQNYTARSRGISDADRRLLAERRDTLRAAVVSAGRSFERYTRNVEREQQRRPMWPG
jgi:hypothetical protein